MLDSKGFDLWAGEYDKAVGVSEAQNTYPFAGYKKILGEIFADIMDKPKSVVLDLGFGTATLTGRLYDNGHTIYGQDFSQAMIETAAKKMPNAKLFKGDFAEGLVAPLKSCSYDFIVATYSFHHVPYEKKAEILSLLFERLNDGGEILIGDIAFSSREELEKVAKSVGSEWDGDEYYSVVEELRPYFPKIAFEKVSFCAGVITIAKN